MLGIMPLVGCVIPLASNLFAKVIIHTYIYALCNVYTKYAYSTYDGCFKVFVNGVVSGCQYSGRLLICLVGSIAVCCLPPL